MNKSYLIMWIFIYQLLAVITVSRSTNILVFAPMPFKSHFRGFQPLFKELAGRGYNLTVVSTFPLNKPLENYTDIPIAVDERILKGFQPLLKYILYFRVNNIICKAIDFESYTYVFKQSTQWNWPDIIFYP